MSIRQLIVRSCLVSLVTFAACSAPQARVMDDKEDDLVGGTSAGAETYDRIVNTSVKELLNKYTDEVLNNNAPTGLNVAFAGLENKQREELGEWRDELNQLIDTSINEYKGFRTVSQRYVEAALRETGLTVDQLLLPAQRRKFLQVLEVQSGNPVKAIVWATLTGGGQGQGSVRQQRYRLTLDMVDSETGHNLKADGVVRKEYNR